MQQVSGEAFGAVRDSAHHSFVLAEQELADEFALVPRSQEIAKRLQHVREFTR